MRVEANEKAIEIRDAVNAKQAVDGSGCSPDPITVALND